jgi:hypothetical protein
MVKINNSNNDENSDEKNNYSIHFEGKNRIEATQEEIYEHNKNQRENAV